MNSLEVNQREGGRDETLAVLDAETIMVTRQCLRMIGRNVKSKMNYHSQNLNESNTGEIQGSMLWRGRAWLKRAEYRDFLHCEWYFGKYARMFRWSITFGDGDSDDGVLCSAGIPWLFEFYFGIAGVWRTQKKELGLAIHNHGLWLYTLSSCNEWRSKDPWWKQGFHWSFPWEWDWYSTDILEHTQPALARAVHVEKAGHKLGDSFDRMRLSQEAAKTVSIDYPYTYVRKSGEVQNRIATVFVERRTWRMKWWWLLPFKTRKTTISVKFDGEVGEGTGSWKGGTIGCGYDMLVNETPEECLRRMEAERKFER